MLNASVRLSIFSDGYEKSGGTTLLDSLQCQQCGKLFTNKSKLLWHEVVHTGVSDYPKKDGLRAQRSRPFLDIGEK